LISSLVCKVILFSGIDESIKASFQKIRDEAAHVDPHKSNHTSGQKQNVISVNVPLVLRQNQ